MKLKHLILLLSLSAVVLLGCGTKEPAPPTQSPRPTQPAECTVERYKSSATPIMSRYGDIVDELDLQDPNSRAQARSKLLILADRIGRVNCREQFPLKHETLEFSVKHLLDALDYADQGQYDKVTDSINYALANVERFNNWSVDLGK